MNNQTMVSDQTLVSASPLSHDIQAPPPADVDYHNFEGLEREIQRAIQRVRSYDLHIDPSLPILLNVDGMSENNPGEMGVGIYAHQTSPAGDAVIFTEHIRAGYGSCNEAEYIAVKCGLSVLRAICPVPGRPVEVFTDSQLVAKQLAGIFTAQPKMQILCTFLRRLRKVYPFNVNQIPRAENQITDGLAQEHILKHSGRALTLDHGRLNAIKSRMESTKTEDPFRCLTSQKWRDHFIGQSSALQLPRRFQEIKHLCSDGRQDQAIALAQQVLVDAEGIFKSAPQTNSLAVQWAKNTREIVQQAFNGLIEAIKSGEILDVHYLIDEFSGAEATGHDMFDSQADYVIRESATKRAPSLQEHTEGSGDELEEN